MVLQCNRSFTKSNTDLFCIPIFSLLNDDFFVFFFQNESGRVTLEGCLSDDYYRVRELLYGQYAII